MQARNGLTIAALAVAAGLAYLTLGSSDAPEPTGKMAAAGDIGAADANPSPEPAPSATAPASTATDAQIKEDEPASAEVAQAAPPAPAAAPETKPEAPAPAAAPAQPTPPAATTPAPPPDAAATAPAGPAPTTPGAPAQPTAPVNPNAAAGATPAKPGPATPGAAAGGADPAAVAKADPATVAASENDWPCVQAKVHTIDEVAVWDGPPVGEIQDWFSDDAIAKLVQSIVSRRMPISEAEKAVETFAQQVPEAERDAKLTKLFAGVLQTANTQRNSIVGGIERFQKRQRDNAKEIEKQGEEISKLEDNAPSDLTIPVPEIDKARERYDWFTRVFQERQSNIPIACELPTLIEQRVFALARAIRAQMKS